MTSTPTETTPATITKETVKHVAKLARLDLTPAEVESFTTDLSKILTLVEQLNELDLDAVDMTVSPQNLLETVYRPDGTELPLDRRQVLANAPQEEDGYFRVPKILETPAKQENTTQSNEVTHA